MVYTIDELSCGTIDSAGATLAAERAAHAETRAKLAEAERVLAALHGLSGCPPSHAETNDHRCIMVATAKVRNERDEAHRLAEERGAALAVVAEEVRRCRYTAAPTAERIDAEMRIRAALADHAPAAEELRLLRRVADEAQKYTDRAEKRRVTYGEADATESLRTAVAALRTSQATP